jgi:hypothetical protein
MMRETDSKTTRKNIVLGLALGGVAVLMFLVTLLWAWQYISLIP